MADFTSSPRAGEYDYAQPQEFTSPPVVKQLTTLTNAAGAAVSLALVVGIGVWGYKLLVRDVTGIPVVAAAQGEMRVRPEEPGGQLAQHQGLSVNAVAAEGSAAAPADRLRLAPNPVDITKEDHIVPVAVVADAPQPQEPPAPAAEDPAPVIVDVAAALEAGNVEELVAKLTDGLPPLTQTPAEPDKPAAQLIESTVAEVAEEPKADPQPEPAIKPTPAVLDAPGVRTSLRPQKRPSQRAQVVKPR